MGKIIVIKSLIISKLTHLLISLPDPSEQFNNDLEKELYDYLWDGKNSKIKKSVVCKPYNEGGLQMLDIKAFITSLKVSWLKKLRVDSDWKDFTVNMFPDLINLDKRRCEFVNVLMERTTNVFGKDVLRHYNKLSNKCYVSTLDEFVAECIHYNVNILRDRKVIFVKEWCDNDILWIRQLVNDNGNFMCFEEFRMRYPHILRTNFLMYEGIINAIKRYREKYDIKLSSNFKTFDSKVWHVLGKRNKHVQSVLLKSEAVPTAIDRWNKKYDNLNWKNIYKMCIKTTYDVQLRWFQLRILHRILSTEKLLYTCRIVESPLCTFYRV